MNLLPFARLLSLQRTEDARERLHKLRQEYALTDSDPIWAVVAVVEEFCVELKSESARSAASPVTSDRTPEAAGPRTLDRTRSIVLCSAAAALQTFLLAVSAYTGAHATIGGTWLASVLAVPVGWVVFALLLPLLGAVTFRGWRVRHAEPAIGWTLALCGMAASGAMLIALWRLL